MQTGCIFISILTTQIIALLALDYQIDTTTSYKLNSLIEHIEIISTNAIEIHFSNGKFIQYDENLKVTKSYTI